MYVRPQATEFPSGHSVANRAASSNFTLARSFDRTDDQRTCFKLRLRVGLTGSCERQTSFSHWFHQFDRERNRILVNDASTLISRAVDNSQYQPSWIVQAIIALFASWPMSQCLLPTQIYPHPETRRGLSGNLLLAFRFLIDISYPHSAHYRNSFFSKLLLRVIKIRITVENGRF